MKEWLVKLVFTCLAVLAPIKPVLIATGFAVILDLITGIWKAVKQKEKIKSSVMRRTVTKMLVFQVAIISGFIIETYMVPDIPISKIVSSAIGLVEATSIIENLNAIYGTNIFKSILTKLGSDNDNTDK